MYNELEAKFLKERQLPRDEITQFKEVFVEVKLKQLSTSLQSLDTNLKTCHEVSNNLIF